MNHVSADKQTIAAIMDLARQIQAAPPKGHAKDIPVIRIESSDWDQIQAVLDSIRISKLTYDSVAMDVDVHEATEALFGSIRRWVGLYGRSPNVMVSMPPINHIDIDIILP